jgi:hypothetical protein
VTGVNDAVVDGNIAYTIVTDPATSSDSHYNEINPADVSVTNIDDDTPVAPETTITSNPSDPSSSSDATFEFTSSESTFECSLDGAAFSSCTSPTTYTGLGDGSHNFQVRATDAAGNADPTAASYTWTVDTSSPGGSVSYMYVQSVNVTLARKGRSWEGKATVIVTDDTGTLMPEATVTGDWDLNGTSFNSGASRTTNGRGQARINSGKVTANSGDVFTFTVTDLSRAGFTWDNSVGEQSGTATVP